MMSEHHVAIDWKRESSDFTYQTYNRDHDWTFKSGLVVRGSAHPDYLGSAGCVDPEEAFVASLASCHMLTFLAIASKKKWVVDLYRDQATGILEKGADGRWAVTRVTLRPEIIFHGDHSPDPEALAVVHDQAHHACFIANSVKTVITVEPR